MKWFKLLLSARLVAVAIAATHATCMALNVSSGEIEPGRWNSNFALGKKYAEANNIPLVLFAASSTCSNCEALKGALTDGKVDAWMEERQMVMVLATDDSAATDFARNNSKMLPYICVYWPKTDGLVSTNRFSGLLGRMTVDGGSLADQFMASVDYHTSGWAGVFKGAEFKVGDVEGSRLEAIAGKTKFVDVPLIRTPIYADNPDETYMISTFPGVMSPVTNIIVWAAGETNKLPRLVFPAAYIARNGDRILVELTDGTEVGRRSSAITIVPEPGNSSVNPLWLNDDFQFGRFTFDYTAATNAVAEKIAIGERAYTIVLFTGALWCPYCNGLEKSLLSDSRFYEWAESNNVALVVFDQGRASSPATAAGTLAPRLLTYEPDPRLEAAVAVSGAGYVSRHAVERADAEMILAMTTYYTKKWLAPQSTAARLSQPTFLLVENDEVKARFSAQRNAERVYDVEENIARLNDFLHLSDGDGEAANYTSTTPLTYNIGNTATSSLQISDRVDYYRINGLHPGRLEVAMKPSSSLTDVIFSLVIGEKAIAAGTNGLSSVVSQADLSAGAAYLKVEAYPSPASKIFVDGGVNTSSFDLTFSSSIILVPEEKNNHVFATGEYMVEVERDVVYRLAGFEESDITDNFVSIDDEKGLYSPKFDGVVELTATAADASYQIWRPGDISFDDAVINVEESTGEIEICIRRTGGTSNKAKVVIDIDSAASVASPLATYNWEATELSWEDGESGPRTATLALYDDTVADGDRTLVLQIKKILGEGLTISSPTCRINIAEDDAPARGYLALSPVSPMAAGKARVIACETNMLTMCVKRLAGSVGAAGVKVKLSDNSLTPVSLAWDDNDRKPTKFFTLDLSQRPEGAATDFSVVLEEATLPVAQGANAITVKTTPAEAPFFAAESVQLAFTRYVAGSQVIAIAGAQSSDIDAAKISGGMPPGLATATDGARGLFVVSGTPTAAGEWECIYQLYQKRDGVHVAGGIVRLTISVADPVERAKNDGSDSVLAVATAFQAADIPVYDSALKRITGLITISIRPTGRNSAKYICAGGIKAMTSTSWLSYNEKDNSYTAELSSRDGAYNATIVVASDGSISGNVTDPAFVYDELTLTSLGSVWSANYRAEAFAGRYTIAFAPSVRISGGESAAVTGCAGFSAKLVGASAMKSGRMAIAGRLPNGKTVSGNFTLAPKSAGATATLPIYIRSSGDIFAGAVQLAANAYETYLDNGGHQAIVDESGIETAWSHTEQKTSTASFAMAYTAYGSYYDPDEDLSSCLEATDVSKSLNITVWSDELPSSRQYGSASESFSAGIAEVDTSGIVLSSANGLTLRFNKTTGIITGSAKIPYSNKIVNASIYGVVLPGWTGCGCVEGEIDLPFMLGSCWFSDRFYYSKDYQSCTELSEPDRVITIKRGCRITAETTAE